MMMTNDEISGDAQAAVRPQAAGPRATGAEQAEAERKLPERGMVERTARAHDPVGWEWFDRTRDQDDAHVQRARVIFLEDQTKRMRAAIGAMREPTDAMAAAGAIRCHGVYMGDGGKPVCAMFLGTSGVEVWRAMVNKALAPSSPSSSSP